MTGTIPGERFLFLKKRNKRQLRGEIFFCRKDGFFTSCLQRKTDGSYVNRPFCVTRWRRQQENRETTAPHLIFLCFFSSKKKRRGTIFYLKKRNKRQLRGRFSFAGKTVFSHPACNEKTDGSYENRPFCVTRWRRQQENREPTAPHLIFFCFFSSKKKRRGTIFYLKKRNKRQLRGRFSFAGKTVFLHPACNEKRTVRM